MWDPRILAAEAITAEHFVVALGELAYDDPFTAVIEYDAAFPQPWSRTDIAREIKAITQAVPRAPGRYVVVSDEGDVYFIGDDTMREKIVGAGVASPDATGLGGVLALARLDERLVAAGQGAQVYQRIGSGRWDRVIVAGAADAGYKPDAFTAIKAASDHDIYILGFAAPEVKTLDPDQEQKLLEAGDWDDIFAAHDLTADAGHKVDQGRVFHFDGAAWRQLDLPGPDVIKDAFIETPDKVWLVGTGGTVLVGNARAGFRRIDLAGFDATFLSMTKLNDTYVLASDYALHTFDGHQLTPLKPRLRTSPPNPLRVQAIGGAMFYFDSQARGSPLRRCDMDADPDPTRAAAEDVYKSSPADDALKTTLVDRLAQEWGYRSSFSWQCRAQHSQDAMRTRRFGQYRPHAYGQSARPFLRCEP